MGVRDVALTAGAISDTHGNLRLMQAAAERLVEAHGAAYIFHLGDDYADFEALSAPGAVLRGVPGLWCPAFRGGRVPRVIEASIEGWTLACAHTEEQLAASPALLALHGHTHVARIEAAEGRVWINPGHLKAPRDRGQRPSYAVLRIDGDAIDAAIHELDGTVRMARRIARSALESGRT